MGQCMLGYRVCAYIGEPNRDFYDCSAIEDDESEYESSYDCSVNFMTFSRENYIMYFCAVNFLIRECVM